MFHSIVLSKKEKKETDVMDKTCRFTKSVRERPRKAPKFSLSAAQGSRRSRARGGPDLRRERERAWDGAHRRRGRGAASGRRR